MRCHESADADANRALGFRLAVEGVCGGVGAHPLAIDELSAALFAENIGTTGDFDRRVGLEELVSATVGRFGALRDGDALDSARNNHGAVAFRDGTTEAYVSATLRAFGDRS